MIQPFPFIFSSIRTIEFVETLEEPIRKDLQRQNALNRFVQSEYNIACRAIGGGKKKYIARTILFKTTQFSHKDH